MKLGPGTFRSSITRFRIVTPPCSKWNPLTTGLWAAAPFGPGRPVSVHWKHRVITHSYDKADEQMHSLVLISVKNGFKYLWQFWKTVLTKSCRSLHVFKITRASCCFRGRTFTGPFWRPGTLAAPIGWGWVRTLTLASSWPCQTVTGAPLSPCCPGSVNCNKG